MDNLVEIEKQRGISLPKVYKDFYTLCSFSTPKELVGTDLFNRGLELNQGANELLKADGTEFSLDDDDFVFMMHQGYMFWYFKADGNPDPIVYGYHEGKLKPYSFGPFSDFVKEYMD